MIKIILILLAAVYIYSIISSVLEIKQISVCIDVLALFLSSAKLSPYGELIKNPDFDTKLNEVLFRYPVIQKFGSIYSAYLSYNNTPSENYRSAIELYNDLLMKRNYLVNNFYSSFNPINTLKKLAVFPSYLLTFFGFRPNIYASRIFNLCGWVLTYLLGLYQNEIKTLITSLLKHL